MSIKRIIKIIVSVFFILLIVLLIGTYFIAKKGFDKKVELKKESIQKVLNIKEFMNAETEFTTVVITDQVGGYDSSADYYIEGTFHLHEYFLFDEVNFIKSELIKRIKLIESDTEELSEDDLITNFGIEKPEELELLKNSITRINKNDIDYSIESFNNPATSFIFVVSAEGLTINSNVDIVYIKDEINLFLEVVTDGLVK